MHLILKATGEGAGIVSHLLSKNPNNVYDRTDKGVHVRMVYTTAAERETEVLMHAEPDPVDLVRGTPDGYDITQYINDREFVTSSLFCSYIRSALGTALNGKPKEAYAQWVGHPFDMELTFGPVASDLPDQAIEELFSPLGYSVTLDRDELDYTFDLKRRALSAASFFAVRSPCKMHCASYFCSFPCWITINIISSARMKSTKSSVTAKVGWTAIR